MIDLGAPAHEARHCTGRGAVGNNEGRAASFVFVFGLVIQADFIAARVSADLRACLGQQL